MMGAKVSKSVVFSVCSLLMAFLFAVSAYFQLDDTDWFLWFSLYTCGCIVNLINGVCRIPKITIVAKFCFWLGVYLFIRVLIEGLENGLFSRLYSLDMRERVVREQIGSALVIGSMYIHLKSPLSSRQHQPKPNQTKVAAYGMLALVVLSYGLSLLFYLCHEKEMRF